MYCESLWIDPNSKLDFQELASRGFWRKSRWIDRGFVRFLRRCFRGEIATLLLWPGLSIGTFGVRCVADESSPRRNGEMANRIRKGITMRRISDSNKARNCDISFLVWDANDKIDTRKKSPKFGYVLFFFFKNKNAPKNKNRSTWSPSPLVAIYGPSDLVVPALPLSHRASHFSIGHRSNI